MYFQYNESTYEQTEGATIGSAVPAVNASLYMESFKDQAVTSPYKPGIWKRYIAFLIPDAETPTCRGKFCLQSLSGYVGHFETRMAPHQLSSRLSHN